MIFGRLIGAGNRNYINILNLKKRRFLGPTSMDAELALLMCNIAKVRRNVQYFK